MAGICDLSHSRRDGSCWRGSFASHDVGSCSMQCSNTMVRSCLNTLGCEGIVSKRKDSRYRSGQLALFTDAPLDLRS